MSDDKQLYNRDHVALMQLFVRRVVKDPDGTIAFDSGVQPSHSYVLQWLDIIMMSMDHVYNVDCGITESVTDTGNTARTLTMNGTYHTNRSCAVAAPANTATYGLVIGTGNAAEANTDYALQTQIAHGAGAGQMNYGATGITRAAVVGANVDGLVTRSWTNGSGNTITVNEIGIYSGWEDSTPTQRNFCLVRDVLAVGDAVNNGQTYTVTYTLRTSV